MHTFAGCKLSRSHPIKKGVSRGYDMLKLRQALAYTPKRQGETVITPKMKRRIKRELSARAKLPKRNSFAECCDLNTLRPTKKLLDIYSSSTPLHALFNIILFFVDKLQKITRLKQSRDDYFSRFVCPSGNTSLPNNSLKSSAAETYHAFRAHNIPT